MTASAALRRVGEPYPRINLQLLGAVAVGVEVIGEMQT